MGRGGVTTRDHGHRETEMSEFPPEAAIEASDEHSESCSVQMYETSGKLNAAGGPSQVGGHECRICLSSDNQDDLVQPCHCTGTVKHAHLSCLRSWCMENLALKCEICGSVYKDEVVNALMSTLAEAQERQAASADARNDYPTGLWFGSRNMRLPNDSTVQIDLGHGRGQNQGSPEGAVRIVRLGQQNGMGGAAAQPPLNLEDEQRAQERMQAFLEELLQIYTLRSEAILERYNRDGFRREEEMRARRRAIGTYACAVTLLIFWIVLFFSLSSMFASNRFLGASVVLIAILVAVAVTGFIRVRALMRARAETGREEVSRREARDAARARLRERADLFMLRPATVRVIR